MIQNWNLISSDESKLNSKFRWISQFKYLSKLLPQKYFFRIALSKNTFWKLLPKKTFSKFQTFDISRFCREPTILSQISRSHSKAQNPHGKLTSNTLSFLCAHRRYFLKRLTCLPRFSVESKKFIKESLIYKHKK